ncbi:MAG: PepSY-associated TM helix domain-containing protein [Planctomycetes bacterium]|nr:PepSY-associated TM helix domain-containing protein [Planctomycetota bacterium]
MNWRFWVRVLHRDVGYFLTGLVVVFALSGIAVNHVDSWNPSYARTTAAVDIGPLVAADLDGMEREVVARVPLDPADVKGRHRESPHSFRVFLDEGGEVSVDPATGRGTMLRVRRRPVLFEANALHLNHLKGVWTWVSDAFAVLLAGLAITGLFMLRGSNGLAGRGKWFVAGGLAVPVGFAIAYYATH